ncbi:MAG: hypothetical protein NWE91_09070 [Candidatus Bathyarchaeota archaeon]|nr:hypothetical protein [Candidatus Bathyarchaeota archaeon]
MQLITEVLFLPEVLFAGRIILATTFFVCIYAMISEVFSDFWSEVLGLSKIWSHILGVIIGSYAFQIPFPDYGPFPALWAVSGFVNIVIFFISLSMAKFMAGFELVFSQFYKREGLLAAFLIAGFVFVIFLPAITMLFRHQLGALFPLVFNITWLLDFGFTLLGAIKGLFGTFKEIYETAFGSGYRSKIISVLFVVVSIIIVPQLIPYSSVIIKIASTMGVVVAVTYRHRILHQ